MTHNQSDCTKADVMSAEVLICKRCFYIHLRLTVGVEIKFAHEFLCVEMIYYTHITNLPERNEHICV